ncbi:MAG: aminoglycoside 6-adenylyltransferase [Anaerolineae bacterium]|nr:MAG: aminoglycoside 6-adenylyltransferase [Anaerolineae bacterium]
MRSEQEMLDLILDVARKDDRVRAVILNGSRANPNARRDFFQDFDIVYVVTDFAAFKGQPDWIDVFGERMMMQLPDDMQNWDPGESIEYRYAYLIQFTDGNRIDLTLFDIRRLDKLGNDSLTVTLLDKDGILPAFPPASDADYLPRPPSAKQFADITNEFWWVSTYVAKGLWRDEIRYALHALDIIREQLLTLLDWYVGVKTEFKQDPGKWGKHLDTFLEARDWALVLKTYPRADVEECWEALFAACALFHSTANAVAAHFGFDYPQGDDRRVTAHLEHVRQLPADAAEMY